MHDFLNLLSENKNEKGRGSLEGRKAINSKGKNHTNAVKSRVKIYNSITDALRNGHMGQIFQLKNLIDCMLSQNKNGELMTSKLLMGDQQKDLPQEISLQNFLT